MTLTHKIAKHTTIQVVGRVLGYCLSLVSIIFVTRYLGTDGFGRYVIITVFVNAVAILAELGIDQIMIKELYKTKRDNRDEIIANAFALRIVSALIIFIIGALSSHFFPYNSVVVIGIWIVSFSAFLNAISLIFLDIFQISLTMHYQVIADFLGKILTFILVVLSVYLDLGLYFILLAIVAGTILQFSIAYIWAGGLMKLSLKFNWTIWKGLLIKSIPLGISIVLGFIYYKVDTIILSLLKPSYDVGIYGASYKVLDVVVAFPAMFCGLLFPILAGCYAKKHMNRFNALIQKGFDILIITGVPITIILLGLARPIIFLIAGNQFINSIRVLEILAPTAILIFINSIFFIAIVGGDKQNKLIFPFTFLAIFNIVLNLILIPKYSYIGAAIATIATQILALGIPWLLTREFFSTKISFRITLKAMLAGAVMFFVFILIQKFNIGINWNNLENINTFNRLIVLGVVTILGTAIYLGLLYILGGINKTTIQKILQDEEA
ncbi:MAG: oligosaccharide flippase family protein [Candidatus Berkelbacteria bacterium]|nr:oligosaccharide flippase family protein [Candidatus Berkelbacteria bacterium]